jgi:hypothetical protein
LKNDGVGTVKNFIHPDLLRTINFGGNREGEEKYFERIERETEWTEELRKRGFEVHDAWMLVRKQRGLVN